jgi:hypothetical protein
MIMLIKMNKYRSFIFKIKSSFKKMILNKTKYLKKQLTYTIAIYNNKKFIIKMKISKVNKIMNKFSKKHQTLIIKVIHLNKDNFLRKSPHTINLVTNLKKDLETN